MDRRNRVDFIGLLERFNERTQPVLSQICGNYVGSSTVWRPNCHTVRTLKRDARCILASLSKQRYSQTVMRQSVGQRHRSSV